MIKKKGPVFRYFNNVYVNLYTHNSTFTFRSLDYFLIYIFTKTVYSLSYSSQRFL